VITETGRFEFEGEGDRYALVAGRERWRREIWNVLGLIVLVRVDTR